MNRLITSRAIAPVLGLTAVVLALVIIELLLSIGLLNRFVLPFPSSILGSFEEIIREDHLVERFWLTMGETLAAFALSGVIGIAVGVLLYRWRILRLATETWFAALAAAPVVLAYPLFMVVFGRSALTIIMMGFAAGLAPVVLNTLAGLQQVRPTLLNVGRALNLPGQQMFWKIQFPAAVPSIFVGLRLGLIFSMINVVGLEFLINYGGLGQLINELAERYDLPGTYAAIFVVVLVSAIIFLLLGRAEKRVR